MNDEQTFRNVMLIGLLAVLPLGLYFRIKSQATREPLDRRQEGVFILATLRPVALVTAIALVTYLYDPQRMAWSSLPLPGWMRWAGIVMLALAEGLWMWTFRSLGKNLTDTVVTRRDHSLVTSGPYRWVRHPFYGCVALLLLAVSLVSANWFLLASGAVVLWLLVVRTRKEEENLVGRFGDAYRRYMEETGRFWPKLHG